MKEKNPEIVSKDARSVSLIRSSRWVYSCICSHFTTIRADDQISTSAFNMISERQLLETSNFQDSHLVLRYGLELWIELLRTETSIGSKLTNQQQDVNHRQVVWDSTSSIAAGSRRSPIFHETFHGNRHGSTATFPDFNTISDPNLSNVFNTTANGFSTGTSELLINTDCEMAFLVQHFSMALEPW